MNLPALVHSRDGALFVEDCALADIAAQFGTPSYVYSRARIEHNWREIQDALPHARLCYAVKANCNLAVLKVLAQQGAYFDIVSLGELERVLVAGGRAEQIVFSGVGKRADEITRALELGIACFNVESEAELVVLNRLAAENDRRAKVSLRVNPDVDAGTHPYISTGLKDNKFGIGVEQARTAYRDAQAMSHLDVCGIDCHIGSQLTQIEPYLAALDCLLALVDELRQDGIDISHIDLGGGFGIQYQDEQQFAMREWADAIMPRLEGRGMALWLEPGRRVVGDAGLLLTQVHYLKQNGDKHFAVIDAAMNDLIRPALYSAWQQIVEVAPSSTAVLRDYDVVGPVCESADFLGKSRSLRVEQGDYLAVLGSGAYAFGMASNYNTRARACELMVDGAQTHVVRRREALESLWALESVLP